MANHGADPVCRTVPVPRPGNQVRVQSSHPHPMTHKAHCMFILTSHSESRRLIVGINSLQQHAKRQALVQALSEDLTLRGAIKVFKANVLGMKVVPVMPVEQAGIHPPVNQTGASAEAQDYHDQERGRNDPGRAVRDREDDRRRREKDDQRRAGWMRPPRLMPAADWIADRSHQAPKAKPRQQ